MNTEFVLHTETLVSLSVDFIAKNLSRLVDNCNTSNSWLHLCIGDKIYGQFEIH